jgi:hypothetical protein
MTSDQQRGIDEMIIQGRLIDAIGMYRTATGCGLAEAESAVRQRSAALNAGTPSSTPPPISQPYSVQPFSTQTDSPPADAAIRTAMRPVVPILAFALIMTLIPIVIAGVVIFGVVKSMSGAFGSSGGGTLGTIGTALTAPGKLGGQMLVSEPYYPDVVKDIEGDPNFRAALGSPIAIDRDGITCRMIKNGYTSRTANCTLPVHGPNAAGSVTIAVVDQPGSFGVAGQLATGGRTIDMTSR